MLSWYLPLLIFILIACFTPGPNNIIAMSIGFNFGFKKVIPHIFGVAVGFPIMLLLIGFIIKDLMHNYEYIFNILKYISFIYLIYLSYKIATAPVDDIDINSDKKSISFIESLAFQWINPKSWAGALATITIYLPKENYQFALIVASITSAIAIIFAISLWGFLGKKIKKLFSKKNHIKVFNILMAFLLLASVSYMLFD